MLKAKKATSINDSAGFRRMFAPDRLSLGVFFPIEAFERDEPSMRDQPRLARRAEELGFTGLWTRDVPMRDPNFGDLGQVYDPWVWLGWIGRIPQRSRLRPVPSFSPCATRSIPQRRPHRSIS